MENYEHIHYALISRPIVTHYYNKASNLLKCKPRFKSTPACKGFACSGIVFYLVGTIGGHRRFSFIGWVVVNI